MAAMKSRSLYEQANCFAGVMSAWKRAASGLGMRMNVFAITATLVVTMVPTAGGSRKRGIIAGPTDYRVVCFHSEQCCRRRASITGAMA